MTKNDLYKELYLLEKRVQSARTKRTICTVGFFAVVYFVLLWWLKPPSDLIGILGGIAAAVVFGSIHFYVNAIVFSNLSAKSQAEDKAIELLQKQIREFDNTTRQE